MTSFNLKKPEMVVSRTPMRVSFAGGGTDLPDFFTQAYGAVLSTTINKYIYVTVKKHGVLFNEKYRLNYSSTESVKRLDDVQNEIMRECLKLVPVETPLYVSTVADLPASSGLGSSGSFAVGLLNALHAFRGENVTAAQLAQEAYDVEVKRLKRPVGKQDQYAAAFGGLNYFRFQSDDRVTIEPITLSNEEVMRLFDHLLLFWTNISRDAGAILGEQQKNNVKNNASLMEIREHAQKLRSILFDRFDPISFGKILDETWQLKRKLADSISNSQIDFWYDRAKSVGAVGGKIAGAGGGGFLCLVTEPDKKSAVAQALAELPQVQLSYEPQGTKILFEQ